MREPRLFQHPRGSHRGFSLVELLVALVFMAVLMAGMAKIFQSSLNTSYKSSESISSGRRNRMAMDLLYDDLNAAGQYLVNITAYPTLGTSQNDSGFYILPNQTYTGTDEPPPPSPLKYPLGHVAITDQLTFYMDEALPFEGRLLADKSHTFASTSNADLVASQANVATLDTTMEVKFQDPSYAQMVKTYSDAAAKNGTQGLVAIFKDQWGPVGVSNVAVSGSTVSFSPQASPDNSKGLPTGLNLLNQQRHFAGDGSFPSGLPPTIGGTPGTSGAPVLFVRPAQMVRYLIKAETLDPTSTVGVPCLVRQQGDYNSAGFVPSEETIIAEDVTGFKVYLSAYPDPGNDPTNTWAGLGLTANDFDTGWTAGILGGTKATTGFAGITEQLKDLGLVSATSASDPNWFRNTPLLVRVDLTTRSAIKRSTSATAATSAYQYHTQTLYMVPRHFGLSFN